ncbi:DUF883 family protein [Oceaniglobus trochenteri]|uniref:DUF883 family protein n=1 Tax=Oceaniglobus trochenteri TaxID=2763260 RepID=UPI001CFFF809|nr:DUF883 domain-containing protein [Oceaniglobus trochenteri]
MATSKIVTTEDLSAQVDTLKSDIAGLTKIIGDLTKTKGEQVADGVRAQANSAREAGEAQLAELQKHARSGAESAEEYVRNNPATALGIAAGIGVLVGLITARR